MECNRFHKSVTTILQTTCNKNHLHWWTTLHISYSGLHRVVWLWIAERFLHMSDLRGRFGHSAFLFELLLEDSESLSLFSPFRRDLGVSGLSKFSEDLAPAIYIRSTVLLAKYSEVPHLSHPSIFNSKLFRSYSSFPTIFSLNITNVLKWAQCRPLTLIILCH